MVVRTTTGSLVSIESTDGRNLYDNNHTPWERYPAEDDADHAAYIDGLVHASVIKLDRSELRRMCAGHAAISTPTTVVEMRYHALKFTEASQLIVDSWSDQELEDILEEAKRRHKDAGELLRERVCDALTPPPNEEIHEEATGEAKEATEEPKTAKNTPKKRKREKGIPVITEYVSTTLTSKQVEFLERLSENPDWDRYGIEGEYAASLYAEELDDTMNSMSVGAVLTTLREKRLLTTRKASIGGVKVCMFKLTPAGRAVYKYLCNYAKEG